MNCSLQQFDPRHFAQTSHWIQSTQSIPNVVIKSEPKDEMDFMHEKTAFSTSITPSNLSQIYSNYPTPPSKIDFRDFHSSNSGLRNADFQTLINIQQSKTDYASDDKKSSNFREISDTNRNDVANFTPKLVDIDSNSQQTNKLFDENSSTTENHKQFVNTAGEISPPSSKSDYSDFHSSSESRSPPQYLKVSSPFEKEKSDRKKSKSPKHGLDKEQPQPSTSLTPPISTPSPSEISYPNDHMMMGEYYENGDSLHKLQMALQKTGMIPEEKLKCPVCDFYCNVRSQFNDHLLTHETKCTICDYEANTKEKLKDHMKDIHDQQLSDDEYWNEDEPGLTIPKVNSQGKVKTFKCKQCDYSAVTKLDFWKHLKVHIKSDRLLSCPKCPFITEYKHHLEYHILNHFGSKPFKCDKCSYSCVNKSMLNSHLKSHSNVYQFRCNDCNYVTKYCHSLKLHLRKYKHSPAMVLNSDGTPNPLPIVDVYGTRRGPKQKGRHSSSEKNTSNSTSPLPSLPMFNPYAILSNQIPYLNLINTYSSYNISNSDSNDERPPSPENNFLNDPSMEEDKDDDRVPLDLTCAVETQLTIIEERTPTHRNRRKGKAFKLEQITARLQRHQNETDDENMFHESDGEEDEAENLIKIDDNNSTADIVESSELLSKMNEDNEKSSINDSNKSEEPLNIETVENKVYTCQYCEIIFKDVIMYTVHMGYHGFQDPFTCNMCGQQTSDKVAFFLHIARNPHS